MDTNEPRRLAVAACAAIAIAIAISTTAGRPARAEKIKIEYEVKKGDSLNGVGERFGVSVQEILDWNAWLVKEIEEETKIDAPAVEKAAIKLKTGLLLKIPGKPSSKKGTIAYKVKKGDSLWSIGQEFNVKPSVIVKWNKKALGVDEPAPPAAPPAPAAEIGDLPVVAGTILYVPGKPSNSPDKVIKYKVEKGDSLWSIGKKFHVKPSVIVKWNKKHFPGASKAGGKGGKGKKEKLEPDSDEYPIIHAGDTIVIHATRPDAGDRVAALEVKPGDTIKEVAAQYGSDMKLLLAVNFLLPKDKLVAGDIIDVPLPVTQKDTKSVGAPNSGKLVSGEKMPEGPGYVIKHPSLAFATSETINGLVTCIAAVQKKFEGTKDMIIGHLSKPAGGKLKPHKSHQSGRDVDVAYYRIGDGPPAFGKATAANIDVKRTNAFVECLVSSGEVEYIFIDTYIQKILYEDFEARGYGEEFLEKVFQYPRGKGKQLGVVRDEEGHDDHMHLRFVCPPGDSQCQD